MGRMIRRRSKITWSWKRRRNRLMPRATSVHDLTDDLLELVLLGLDSPVCLARAAATCKQWRRVVAGDDDGAAFIRRFRSLHPPRAIGTFYSINLDTPYAYDRSHRWPAVDPVFVPSSASGSDGSSGLQLSLDFVPPPAAAAAGPRELVDGRGSLLLLLNEKQRPHLFDCLCCYHHGDYMIPDLVVCEPLTRQYQAIPPPNGGAVCILSAFLLDSGAAIGMTNFRVLLVLYEHHENGSIADHDFMTANGYPSASVFTCGSNGGGGRWHQGEPDYDDGVYLPSIVEVHLAGRTGGRIYWGCDDKQVMVLDEDTLEFSTMALADRMMNWTEFGRGNLRVVGGSDGTVRIVHIANNGGRGDLEIFRKPHGDSGTIDWVLDTRVELIEASRGVPGHREVFFAVGIEIIDVQEESFVLSMGKKSCMWLFSVHLETMELKREYRGVECTGPAFPYMLPWPRLCRPA